MGFLRDFLSDRQQRTEFHDLRREALSADRTGRENSRNLATLNKENEALRAVVKTMLGRMHEAGLVSSEEHDAALERLAPQKPTPKQPIRYV